MGDAEHQRMTWQPVTAGAGCEPSGRPMGTEWETRGEPQFCPVLGKGCGGANVTSEGSSREEGTPKWTPGGPRVSRDVEVGALEEDSLSPTAPTLGAGPHQSPRLELGVVEGVLDVVWGTWGVPALHAGTAQATASPSPAWEGTACFALWQPG